ncbi:MAG: hypothetical protein HYY78_15580 [Betaproteobacteria bacterium]|nr:hypothetical protein [Betaproteobacteria bacterium]
MTNAPEPCKTCGSATKITTLGSFRGEQGPVVVIVNGMPALVCDQGHKRFLYPGFADRLMDFVADAEKVAPQPPAARRGWFRKRYHCNGCDAELPAVPTKKSECVLDASFENAAPFKVVVQVALYKCEGCGREQVLTNEEVARCAPEAVAHGIRAEDIHTDR